MKRTLTGIAAAALVLGTMAPAAFASTANTLTAAGGKSISVDGTTLYTGVQTGTALDAGTTTQYFPIWYLTQALTKAGYTNNYDSSTNTWNIQMPGVDASKIAVNGGVGSGNAAIAINGIVVKRVNATWHKDFAGGPNAETTTYFPLVYLQYTLQAAGFSNAWDGNNFGFTSNYGTASEVKLSGTTSLVANGTTTTTITATAVDANGHVVRNFNGTATVSLPTADVTGTNMKFAGTTAGYANGLTATQTVNFVNGVGSFTLVAGNTASQSDAFTLASLTPAAGSTVASSVNYDSITVNTVAPVATSLSLKPALPSLDADGVTTDGVVAQVLDQAGVAMPAGGGFVTFSVSGNGTFQGGSTTAMTEYVSNSTTVYVQSEKGLAGGITLAATSSTLGNASVTIPAYIETAPGSIKVVASPTSLAGDGTASTTLTVQLLDKNGNLITDPAVTDSFTVADDTTTNAGAEKLVYTNSGNTTFTTAAQALANGQATFTVKTSAAFTGVANITVTDANGFKQVIPVTFTAGSVAGVQTTASATSVTEGSAVTFSAQLVDAQGNAVKQSGVKVDFVVDSTDSHGTLPTVTYATTDANGVATITGTAAATVGNFGVDAYVDTLGVATKVESSKVAVDVAGNIATQVVAPSGNTIAAADKTTVAAGTSYTGQVFDLENAVNALVSSGASATDKVSFTTSNPAVLTLGAYDSGSKTTDTVAAIGGVANAPTVTANQAGTATITVTDTSVASHPSVTYTITVQAGNPTKLVAVNPDGTVNTAYTVSTAGLVGPFTIEAVDDGGNVRPATQAISLTAAQVLAIVGAGTGVRTSANSADLTSTQSVTIPAGSTSVQVWIDGTAAGATTPTSHTIASEAPAVTSIAVKDATHIVITYNQTLDSAKTPLAADYSVVIAGGTAAAPSAVSVAGNTVTLTVGTIASGNTVTVAYTGSTDTTNQARGLWGNVAPDFSATSATNGL